MKGNTIWRLGRLWYIIFIIIFFGPYKCKNSNIRGEAKGSWKVHQVMRVTTVDESVIENIKRRLLGSQINELLVHLGAIVREILLI